MADKNETRDEVQQPSRIAPQLQAFHVTAIIPAKKNSVRCPKKNVTRFSDSSLLALKIKQLKSCKNLDRIIVSTDDDDAVDDLDDYEESYYHVSDRRGGK